MRIQPDFIIIGAMKCATSTLHAQLALQPGIVMSNPKEPNFFSDDDNWARGPGWYRELFAGAGDDQLCGESSTDYTKLPGRHGVVDRIAEHAPDAKLVYVMRHPIDRLVSHYIHDWTQRVVDVPLTQALDEHPELQDVSRYAMQLEPYLSTFGADRVLPVFHERVRTHPQEVLGRICEFIGHEGGHHWHVADGARNTSAERMRTSRVRDAVVAAPVLATLRRRFVPQRFRERIKQRWRMSERPELAPEELARLEHTFDPDLARLGRWLGVESLNCSNFNRITGEQPLEWATHTLDRFPTR